MWAQLVSGCTVAEASLALSAHFGTPATDLAPDIERFAAELVAEGLVVASDATEPGAAPALGASAAYATPTLEKYTDMQELLALDPPAPGVSGLAWPAAGG